MITHTRYNELLPRYAAFTAAAEAYKQLLQANDLPFGIDFPTVRFAYKTQLFTKLVAVDKGLKMQYDMLKASEAKLKLIDTTIDLTGYDLVDEIINGLQELHETLTAANSAIGYADNLELPTVDMVAAQGWNIAEYLKGYVIDWTADRSKVLNAVNQYAETLTSLVKMLAGYGGGMGNVNEVHQLIADLVAVNADTATATVNELAVYQLIEAAANRAKMTEVQARKEAALRELNREANEVSIAAARKRAAETEAFLLARSPK